MLIDDVLDFADEEYNSFEINCGETCNHPGICPNHNNTDCLNCETCLKQIHFPKKYRGSTVWTDYDCEKMINYYICKYLLKYSSEILYALENNRVIDYLENYDILSIGCGACLDLMAFETYICNHRLDSTINYIGIDKNELWKEVQNQIIQYSEDVPDINVSPFIYDDAISWLRHHIVRNIDVIVLQYFISHLNNTRQNNQFNDFCDSLIDNVVAYKKDNMPMFIIINDANSCYRGRDRFEVLFDKIGEHGYNCDYRRRYFNYRIQHDEQRYGRMYPNINIKYPVPRFIYQYNPWKVCSSAQMIIKID